MKRQDDQFVGGQFDWFIGVVEDNLDQQGRNRVKVRCFGYHTEDKAELPTKDLPTISGTDSNLHWVIPSFLLSQLLEAV